MPTTTRVNGRKIHTPATPDERIAAFREIVTDGAFAKIDGVTIDLFSANYVVQVYDALNDANKKLFASKSAPRMCEIAFKLAK